MSTKLSDRKKENPNGPNNYSAPKNKPPRLDKRMEHKRNVQRNDDPLAKKDKLMDDKFAEVLPPKPTKEEKESAEKIARQFLAAKKDKEEESSREGLENFKFNDAGVKQIAITYKTLAAAFMNLTQAVNAFAACKSSQISPDGKLGGRGYVKTIKEIREEFSVITNTMSGLIDTFHDEVNSPYWKKTTVEDNPIVKEILSQADQMLDKAEEIEETKEGAMPPKLSDEEKEKVKSILQHKKWLD